MDDDERLVLTANEAFYEAFASRDFDGMDELWARERPVTCIHPGRSVLSGRGQIMASWRAILGSDNLRIEPSAAQAYLAGDGAYVLCFEGARDEPPVLIATNVFVREGGHWKIIHHHASPLARAPVTTAPSPAN